MGFQSVDEIGKFSFEDCVIRSLQILEGRIRMELEALIVEPGNSQNTNFTESYAGPTSVVLEGGRIVSAVKEGYRRYDANGKPLGEVPDTPLLAQELDALAKGIDGAFLFSMEKRDSAGAEATYAMRIEFPNEDEYDDSVTESYELTAAFTKAVFSWEYYMNRVQR